MNSTILHIVYATDKGYLLPTIVAACSAVYWASSPNRVIIDVLDCGLDDRDWDEFCRKIWRVATVKLNRHSIDMTRFSGYRIWNASRGIYARLLLPDILKDEDWCVYCDGDTLFTDDPLKLVNFFKDEYAILGHQDHGDDYENWFVTRGFAWDASHYLCAGFLLVNLKWMRSHNGVRSLFDFIERYDPPLNDQHAYYAICYGHIGCLDAQWGEFSVYVTSETLRGCIHYAANTPWRMPSYGIHVCLYDTTRLWYSYAKRLCGYSFQACDRRASHVRYFILLLLTKVLRFCRRDERGVVQNWQLAVPANVYA